MSFIHHHNTKIVCTIGPASQKASIIRRLLKAGMSAALLNFSHGTPEGHNALVDTIRSVSAQLGVPCAILQDLQGPRIRVGSLHEPLTISKGDVVALCFGAQYRVFQKKNRHALCIPVQYDLSASLKKRERRVAFGARSQCACHFGNNIVWKNRAHYFAIPSANSGRRHLRK